MIDYIYSEQRIRISSTIKLIKKIHSEEKLTWQDFVYFVSNDIWGGSAGSSQVNTIFLNTDDIIRSQLSSARSVVNDKKTSFFFNWIYKLERKINCSLSVLFFENICKMQTFLRKQKLLEHLIRSHYDFRLARDYGHEQLFSNGRRFKLAFVKRDRKQTMIDLRGIPTDLFKNH